MSRSIQHCRRNEKANAAIATNIVMKSNKTDQKNDQISA